MKMATKYTDFKSALLYPNNAIAYVYSQIELQKRLLRPIIKTLPHPLAEHVLHCVINHKKLIIFTDAAAWASQLRFYNNAILAAITPFTKEPINLMQIKVISASSDPGSKLIPTPIIPSPEKIMLIRNAGISTSDEQLKRALIKLSTTLQSLSDNHQ